MPSYENAKKLFDLLDQLHEEVKVKASDLMTHKVLSIPSNASLARAAKAMKEKGVSQLPVMDNEKIVGTLSEKDILQRIHDTDHAIDLGQLTVAEVMGEPLPLIREDTTFSLISSLLEHYPAVLIGKKGKAVGIISKSDLLKVLLNRKKK
ncbi:MAG TPA: CBS domain-containing protein [Candidatus Diapherotrites archaeon]|uniref:CBS domain-containing protein n=1 Tax=Candidatus Iainarchaeum sp. TaxID=3101447 RepID=A0A7J4JJ46_9ARCH|nr:CBS domain-containing protein [Candidatus Diapherotrites archaeon]